MTGKLAGKITVVLEAVGYRFAFEPPFVDEGTSPHLDFCS